MKKVFLIIGTIIAIGIISINAKLAFDETVNFEIGSIEVLASPESGLDCDPTVFNLNEKEDCDHNRKRIDCVSSIGNCCRKTSIGKRC